MNYRRSSEMFKNSDKLLRFEATSVKGDWFRKSRQNFALFDPLPPVKFRGGMGEMSAANKGIYYCLPSLVSSVDDVTVCGPGDSERREENKQNFDEYVDVQRFVVDVFHAAVAH